MSLTTIPNFCLQQKNINANGVWKITKTALGRYMYFTGIHLISPLILPFQIENACWQFPVKRKKGNNDLINRMNKKRIL
jgi:hypothetical protein